MPANTRPFSAAHWSEAETLPPAAARHPQDELRTAVEARVRSALNVKTAVRLVPEGTLKRPDHVTVALIERDEK